MDTREQIKELQDRVLVLENFIRSLTSAPSVSNDVQRALFLSLTATSTKSASSENQAVNESGTSTYSVLKPPDRFIKIGSNNLPAYD